MGSQHSRQIHRIRRYQEFLNRHSSRRDDQHNESDHLEEQPSQSEPQTEHQSEHQSEQQSEHQTEPQSEPQTEQQSEYQSEPQSEQADPPPDSAHLQFLIVGQHDQLTRESIGPIITHLLSSLNQEAANMEMEFRFTPLHFQNIPIDSAHAPTESALSTAPADSALSNAPTGSEVGSDPGMEHLDQDSQTNHSTQAQPSNANFSGNDQFEFDSLFSNSQGQNYEFLSRLSQMIGPAVPVNADQRDIDAQLPILVYPTKDRTIPITPLVELVSPFQSLSLSDLLSHTETACLICLENYQQHDPIRILHCKHGFHKNCIDKVIFL
jgi:hypothetical protein